MCAAWCTALSYDEGAKYAFIGDYSGQITVCQLSETGVKLINVLKGITELGMKSFKNMKMKAKQFLSINRS